MWLILKNGQTVEGRRGEGREEREGKERKGKKRKGNMKYWVPFSALAVHLSSDS